MQTREAKLQSDPLEIINQYYKERTDQRDYPARLRKAGIAMGITGTTALAAVLLPSTETAVGAAAAGGITALYTGSVSIRRLYGRFRHKTVTDAQLQDAYAQTRPTEDKTARETITVETPGEEPELDLPAGYYLAQRIRATKLYLAERGRLGDYQEFNWLRTIRVPENLQPTNSELSEAESWINGREAERTAFVDELIRRPEVFIECGHGILPEATRAYLFYDNNPWDNKSQPLLDVMRTLKAREADMEPIGVHNALAFMQGSDHYNGIFSSTGRQRIADFFGKPTYFYTGAERYYFKENHYGVQVPTAMTFNSLPEHLDGLRLHRIEPFSCIEKVEPSATRLKNIGLVLVRA